MRKHAGQVAFPGGSVDPTDAVAGRRRAARGARGGRARPGARCGSSPSCRRSSSRCRASSSRRCWPGGEHPHAVAPVDRGRGRPRGARADRRAGRPGEPVPGHAPVGLARARASRPAACSSGASPPACSTGCSSSAAGPGRGTRRRRAPLPAICYRPLTAGRQPGRSRAAQLAPVPSRHASASAARRWPSLGTRRCWPRVLATGNPPTNKRPHAGTATASRGRRRPADHRRRRRRLPVPPVDARRAPGPGAHRAREHGQAGRRRRRTTCSHRPARRLRPARHGRADASR